MISKEKYGIVYTPQKLAEFVAELLIEEYGSTDNTTNVLDPACGEGALLKALKKVSSLKANYYGIDIDSDIITQNKKQKDGEITYFDNDSVLPCSEKVTYKYWKDRLPNINLIIANPPWSTDRLYERDELGKAGFTLQEGQYDNYVLFIELCVKLLAEGGLCAFILPDSIFYGENRNVRKYITDNVRIKVIARLGEKIFEGVNRATSVIIIEKQKPVAESLTKCFRLNTKERKLFLVGKLSLFDSYSKSFHMVKQSRFSESKDYLFDIDTKCEEEELLHKIEKDNINMDKVFRFGRGVEISKSGAIIECPICNHAQGFTKKQLTNKEKICSQCKETISTINCNVISIISDKQDDGNQGIYVGENIQRYYTVGKKYIKMGVQGIDYKDPLIYKAPKILIRKTGLGINSYLDTESTYISQTVYSLRYITEDCMIPLEYYLSLINSRVVFYYYLKKYGENEWKSHPYLTKDIVFTFPIKEYQNCKLVDEIISLTRQLLNCYSREVDLSLEAKIMKWYGLNANDRKIIKEEINGLPDLGAINNMKF